MIRIQKLKQPKVTSGVLLQSGESCSVQDVGITNNSPFSVHVSEFERKAPKKKAPVKKAGKKR